MIKRLEPESGEPKLSKKKAFAKKLKEKEDAAAKAAEARRLAAEEAKTPEEKLADKLNAQKLAQESDLEVAKDTFGKIWHSLVSSLVMYSCLLPDLYLAYIILLVGYIAL